MLTRRRYRKVIARPEGIRQILQRKPRALECTTWNGDHCGSYGPRWTMSRNQFVEVAIPSCAIPGSINLPFSSPVSKPTRRLGIPYLCLCSRCRRISLREPIQSPVPSVAMNSPPMHDRRSATCLRSMYAPCILQSDRVRAPRTEA